MPKRPARSVLTSLLGASLLVGALVPVTAQPTAAADGATFLSAANVRRAEAGIGPVALHALVDQISTERAHEVAAARQIGHDFPALIARFAELGICWEALGEIVAWNSTGQVDTFIQQWMNSSTHRGIMLSANYTHAGGHSVAGSDGRHYGVMVFARICGATPAPLQVRGPGGFYDTNASSFGADIAWLVGAGITNGCTPDLFCPTQSVTRDQMASFLKRALALPPTDTDFFGDDETNIHEVDINKVAASGTTQGCASARYCPRNTVSREQMASFLARALSLPGTPNDYFTDDEQSPHEADINRLAAAGITTGCGGTLYCPRASVTREQMAAFLHRAFD